MPTLETIRAAVPATLRERLYTYVAAAVFLVSGLGYISNTVAALWAAVVTASITLAFALLHSTSPWRTALYGFLAPIAPLALWYSIGTETGWTAVLTFAALIFGVTKAAVNTSTTVVPVIVDESGVRVDGTPASSGLVPSALAVDIAEVAGRTSAEVRDALDEIYARGYAITADLDKIAAWGLPVWQWYAAEKKTAIGFLKNHQAVFATVDLIRAINRNIGDARDARDTEQ